MRVEEAIDGEKYFRTKITMVVVDGCLWNENTRAGSYKLDKRREFLKGDVGSSGDGGCDVDMTWSETR